jgi:hypothetical protein
VIGLCVACTIAAGLLPFHIDRDDHDHPDSAHVEYVGHGDLVVQTTGRTPFIPVPLYRRPQFSTLLLSWTSDTPLPLRAPSVAWTS